MVLWIVSLALQRIRLSQEAVFSITNTLQLATHDINTVFGISIEKNPNETPHQGSRQEHGAGPTIWVMISVILLTIIRDKDLGIDTISCLSQLVLVIAGFAFVDDTDIINAAKSVNTREKDLLAQQQQVVDTWEKILIATGGVLRPHKSYWCMIDYKYIGNRWIYKLIKQQHEIITVKVADRTRKTLLKL